MEFDFEAMSAARRFEFLTGTVVPRPIALVTTLTPEGTPNAAPYSFFNIMGIDPPVVAFTVLPAADGRMKDTGVNILATRDFVVNLVSEALAEAMNVTCIDAPPGIDELRLAGIATTPSTIVAPPRIAASPVAFECRLHESVALGPGQAILIGRVLHAHVQDAAVIDAERCLFDTPALGLIASLHGARWYLRGTDRFAMDRPSWAEWMAQGRV